MENDLADPFGCFVPVSGEYSMVAVLGRFAVAGGDYFPGDQMVSTKTICNSRVALVPWNVSSGDWVGPSR